MRGFVRHFLKGPVRCRCRDWLDGKQVLVFPGNCGQTFPIAFNLTDSVLPTCSFDDLSSIYLKQNLD